jgi:hypothetical protein
VQQQFYGTRHPTIPVSCGFLCADFDGPIEQMNAEQLTKAKSLGFSDRQIAHLTGRTKDDVRARRKKLGLGPSDRLAGRCAAWFEASTRRAIRPAVALHLTD